MLEKFKIIHFVGIGGIGVSALANLFLEKEAKVTGSDVCPTEITDNLSKKGAKIFNKHSAENISEDFDLIIYSPAIKNDNPELIRAGELNIKTMSYPEVLGEMSLDLYTIAIAGCHGKSTTTAMISKILIENEKDPTVVLGTKLEDMNNENYRLGKSQYFVVEACEYKRSFLKLHPNILVITNIEADHLDYFKDLEDYMEAFKELVTKVPEDGLIIVNADDPNSLEVVREAKAQVIKLHLTDMKETVSLKENSLRIRQAVDEINDRDMDVIEVKPSVPGKFNVVNASLAGLVGNYLHISRKNIESSIKDFKGTWRRLEKKQTPFNKTVFYDDYGHHPTEIKATLQAIREKYPLEKILCVYQPHQYFRTKVFISEIAGSFYNVDHVIISDIYGARETGDEPKLASAKELVQLIIKAGVKAQDGEGLKKTAEYLRNNHQNFDVIITMGAGDITDIYKYF